MENDSSIVRPINSQTIIRALRDILAELYPEEAVARRVVADAELDTKQIAFSSRAQTNWHNVLTQAVNQNRLDALFFVVLSEYSDNPQLKDVHTRYTSFIRNGGKIIISDQLDAAYVKYEDPAPGEPPYKGLQFFDVSDADIFFGREQLTAELANSLRQQRFLAVVGASGSGKSSLVRAGLVASLKRGNVTGVEVTMPNGCQQWPVYLLTPGARPLESLAVSLTQDVESVTATKTLIDDLRRDADSLHLYVRRLLDKTSAKQLLLVVDQFEELFTLCRDINEQRVFVEGLLTAALDNDRTIVVITLRADFYAFCARFEKLRTALEKYQKYIGLMSRAELQHAIEKPAKLGQWLLEPELVIQILDDVSDEPGSLPLLSHALNETWKRRRGRRLTLGGYVAAGGIKGAIAHTADATYRDFSPEQQKIARAIFLRLTELGEGVQDTRRRVALVELQFQHTDSEQVAIVLKALADARLVTTDTDEVQVMHEAVIREWPLLRDEWLADNREGLRIHRRLSEAAQDWQANGGNDPNDLYRGSRLSQVQEWVANHAPVLNSMEQAFLQASQSEAEAEIRRVAAAAAEREASRQRELEDQRRLTAEQKRRTRIVRRFALAVGVLFLITAFMAVNYLIINTDLQASIVETKRNANFVFSRQLAAQSTNELNNGNYETAILLAIASGQVTDTIESYTAIRDVLSHPWHRRSVLYGHTGGVNQASWNRDESKILTSSWDGDVRIWDAATGKTLTTLAAYTDTEEIFQATWNQDESKVLTVSCNRSINGKCTTSKVRIWDVATSKISVTINISSSLVGSAVWSRDESRVLAAGCDKKANYTCIAGGVYIWDATSGKMLTTFTKYTGNVAPATWSRDERRVLTAGCDKIEHDQCTLGSARIFDVATGKELVKFSGYTGELFQATWNRDESKVLAAGCDKIEHGQCILGAVRIWDVTTGKELAMLSDHGVGDFSLTWSRDESKVLIAGFVSGIRVWDVTNNRVLVTFGGNANSTTSQAMWNRDESKILTAGWDGSVRIWDVATGKELFILRGHTDVVYTAIWSQDESKVLTAGSDDAVRIWNSNISKELLTLSSSISNIYDAGLWSQDDSKVLTSNDDGSVHLWDAVTGKELHILSGHEVVTVPPTWNRDESKVLTVGCDKVDDMKCTGFSVRIWDASTGKEMAIASGYTSSISVATWSRDESKVLTANQDGSVRIWDTIGTGSVTFTAHRSDIFQATWSQDESRVLTAGCDLEDNYGQCTVGSVRVWDAATGREISKLASVALSVIWSQDEGKILTTGDGKVRLWDAATGMELSLFNKPMADIYQATWNRDNNKILAIGCEKSDNEKCIVGGVRIWDVNKGKEVITLTSDTDYVSQATWSQDGSKILTVNDNTARIREVTTGKVLVTFSGHTRNIYDAIWNRDESKLLTNSEDGTARIWDATNGKELVRFPGYGIWSHDESRILIRDTDGTVSILYTRMVDLVNAACRWTPRNLTWNEWRVYLRGEDRRGEYTPTCPNAPIPSDAIAEIQDEVRTQIQAGDILGGKQRLEQLNSWLKANGQFDDYGVDISTFMTAGATTLTTEVTPP